MKKIREWLERAIETDLGLAMTLAALAIMVVMIVRVLGRFS